VDKSTLDKVLSAVKTAAEKRKRCVKLQVITHQQSVPCRAFALDRFKSSRRLLITYLLSFHFVSYSAHHLLCVCAGRKCREVVLDLENGTNISKYELIDVIGIDEDGKATTDAVRNLLLIQHLIYYCRRTLTSAAALISNASSPPASSALITAPFPVSVVD
jgi:hypothetical protein